jgi:hypothetical protein
MEIPSKEYRVQRTAFAGLALREKPAMKFQRMRVVAAFLMRESREVQRSKSASRQRTRSD